jgi:hypothetical protein
MSATSHCGASLALDSHPLLFELRLHDGSALGCLITLICPGGMLQSVRVAVPVTCPGGLTCWKVPSGTLDASAQESRTDPLDSPQGPVCFNFVTGAPQGVDT